MITFKNIEKEKKYKWVITFLEDNDVCYINSYTDRMSIDEIIRIIKTHYNKCKVISLHCLIGVNLTQVSDWEDYMEQEKVHIKIDKTVSDCEECGLYYHLADKDWTNCIYSYSTSGTDKKKLFEKCKFRK